jgi:hypothetical protein
MLDVASWARHAGLAEPVVFQLQPGYALRLDAEDRQFLAAGPVHPEIVDGFTRSGRSLDAGSQVRPAGANTWEIRHPKSLTYRIVAAGDSLDVTVPENLDDEAFRRRVAEWSARKSPGGRLLDDDGSPGAALRDALLATGRQFLLKLIDWQPHVVGFRLEGGELGDVTRCVRAVRLVSDAEVVLGGPTATSHPEEVLRDTVADYVFAGEAEESFSLFLRLAWQPNSKDRQPDIPGLAYRYGGRIWQNTLPRDGYGRNLLDVDRTLCASERQCLRNLARPIAAASLLAANRLDWSLLENFRRTFDSLYFTGGRGCPGVCTFCAQMHGRQVRVKTAVQLLEEIEAVDRMVARGAIRLTRWKLFEHAGAPVLQDRLVSWAAIYDEDFFLDRRRAIEFFGLWDRSPLKHRYRLSLQTNPASLLSTDGGVRSDLLDWIARLKVMVQLGAESFHPAVLARWRKRHNLDQLNRVLDALDGTRQDYTAFQLLTDFDTTPEELVESLRRLVLSGYRHRRMRIASSPYTIPLYDSQTRQLLEYRGLLDGGRIGHFTDYERPQPGWMDPLAAELADLADAQLQYTLNVPQRDGALWAALDAVLECLREHCRRISAADGEPEHRKRRLADLVWQAERAMEEIKDARFQAVPLPRRERPPSRPGDCWQS